MADNYTSPFYTPGQYVAQGQQNWFNTPYGTQFREQNQQPAWYAYGRSLGVPDNQSAFSRWFNQQYPLFQQGYASASMEDPYLNIDQYTASLGGLQNWQNQFNAMAPQMRGENPSLYSGVTRVLSR